MDTEQVLVSILIRTCGRPHILKGALESIREQTYHVIEVVVVEDGQNTAQRMLEEEFSDLNIKYACTGTRKGRTVAGNLALSMASGMYLNFLDDDDLLLPDHVKELVSVLEKSDRKAAYAVAYESIVKYDKKRQQYRECRRWVRYEQPFNRVFLTYNNYIPIQCIMFARELYEELGGFDEKLEYLEDWDLWVRYSTRTDYEFVDKITSLYRVPKKKAKRDADLFQAYEIAVKKFAEYRIDVSYQDIQKDLKYILEVIKTPAWKKQLKKIRDKVLYKK